MKKTNEHIKKAIQECFLDNSIEFRRTFESISFNDLKKIISDWVDERYNFEEKS